MSKINILIVEDESIIAMELEDRLNHMGYFVSGSIGNGDTALKKIPELRPDLVLMDINIHGSRNGIETAVLIKEKYNIPFVYLTANNDSETMSRAFESQPYGFIVKPFRANELKSIIDGAIEKFNSES